MGDSVLVGIEEEDTMFVTSFIVHISKTENEAVRWDMFFTLDRQTG